MPFSVSENIKEEDFDPLFVINYTAFADEPAILSLFPGGLDPSVRAQNVAGFKAGLGFGDPHVEAAKVEDEQTGQIVAFATMRMADKNPFYPAENSDVHLPFADHREWVEWVFNTKNDRRRGIKELQVSGSYGYLQALGTDPARQQEGAGTLLLKWVVEKLNCKGAKGMLEASRVAVQHGFYEKQGFRAVDDHTYVDKERFPNAEPVSLVTMVKEKRSG